MSTQSWTHDAEMIRQRHMSYRTAYFISINVLMKGIYILYKRRIETPDGLISSADTCQSKTKKKHTAHEEMKKF
jgi:hypothetical protein